MKYDPLVSFVLVVTSQWFLATTAEAQSIDRDSALHIGGAIYQDIAPVSEEQDDTIAYTLEMCAKGRAPSEYGCYEDAYRKYDVVLNFVYKEALANNDAKTQEVLKESQRRWLTFRDADLRAQDAYSSAMYRGTTIAPLLGRNKVAAIRERIGELMVFTGYGEQ